MKTKTKGVLCHVRYREYTEFTSMKATVQNHVGAVANKSLIIFLKGLMVFPT